MGPLNSAWFLIGAATGSRKVDYYAVQNAFKARFDAAVSLLLRKKVGSATDLLDDTPPYDTPDAPSSLRAQPAAVVPSDRASVSYRYQEEDESMDDFGDQDGLPCCEWDFRHPGTNWKSDDEEERGDNERFCPTHTKAA